jgi:L-ascorbate metabolism protein UlaG (beta-lactamase superfamily)
MDHRTFLTDPIWSEKPFPVSFVGPRPVPPALALGALPLIDFVLISHNHYDHLDSRRSAIRGDGTRFFVPLGDGAAPPMRHRSGRRARLVGQPRPPGSRSTAPAQHWSGRRLTDDCASLWSGWVVTGPTSFYFAGDSGYFPGLPRSARASAHSISPHCRSRLRSPAMMRPVHLDPEEALQAGLDVGAERLLGIHYGTFDLTDEPLDEAPRRFHAEGVRRGMAPERLWTPPLGETLRW